MHAGPQRACPCLKPHIPDALAERQQGAYLKEPFMESQLIFLDCPAYLDKQNLVRCGLPAEVKRRFTMRSTSGPLECAMIRCPAGHFFNAPIESLSLESTTRTAHGQGATRPTSQRALA